MTNCEATSPDGDLPVHVLPRRYRHVSVRLDLSGVLIELCLVVMNHHVVTCFISEGGVLSDCQDDEGNGGYDPSPNS